MSRKPLRRWDWKDNVYGVEYILVVSTWEQFVKECGREYQIDDQEPTALTVLSEPGMIRHVLFWLPPQIKPRTTRWACVIAHEALHAVMGVLADRGIKTMTEDEPATYYLGWVMEEIYKCLSPPSTRSSKTSAPS